MTRTATSRGPLDPREHVDAQPCVLARDVSVRRGETQALHGVSFTIEAGRVTGLFGPSGSGKSTLMRAIVGVQAHVAGRLSVLGVAPGSAQARRQLGYTPQAPSVYDDLTVAENLRYFAAVRGAEIGEALERVGFSPQAHQLVRSLSGGQRARVSLAAALVGRPALLALDEPTVGLDPLLRRDLWRLFGELARAGTTLLVSSHVLDEARHCDELLLLRDGRLIAQVSPSELVARTGTQDMDEAFVRLIEAS
ncbi:MAG TPA: ABC transporter ATP-binding protein [Solirubrobacteraceae bacterium]|nr:ABC transporter ATP-binding protein [Solirubrobacteraceae bacterium]